MAGFRIHAIEFVHYWPARAREISQTPRARRISVALGVVLLVYGVLGFVGMPILLQHVATARLAVKLKRPVAIGRIQFDPYRLRLEIDNLHVADRDGQSPFVDVGHVHVKASWASLFRMAAVIAEVRVDRPRLHIVRSAPQQFNFSDLLKPAGAAPVPAAPKAVPARPFRFALSNISVHDGDIRFDDRVVGSSHEVANIQIGVPFIASLPRDVDIYVQPLLAMVVDGSPLRIKGQTKPLSATRDTVLTLNLHALDLHRYLGYLPVKMPIQVPRGTFSSLLQVHFVDKEPAPVIAIAGRMAFSQVQVNDSSGVPIVGLGHLLVTLNDVEPLGGIYRIGTIRFDQLAPNLVMNAGGSTNWSALLGSQPHEQAAPPAPSAPLTASSTVSAPAQQRAPLEVALDSFRVEHSSVRIVDNSSGAPAELMLTKLHALLQNADLNGQWSAPFELSAAVASGGKVALKGGLDLGDRKANTELALEQIDLSPLQRFAHAAIGARVATGKLDAKCTMEGNFKNALALRIAPASLAIDDLAVAAANGAEQPVKWRKFSVQVQQVDLASHVAEVKEVRGDAIKLHLRRERNGKLNLLAMLQPASPVSDGPSHTRRSAKAQQRISPAEHQPNPSSDKSTPWKFSVASVVLDGAEIRADDEAAPHPASLEFSPLNLRLDNLSSDFARPVNIRVDAKVGRSGTFKAAGDATISPLAARIQVEARQLDVSPADAYLTQDVNAKIASARLSIAGAVSAKRTRRGMLAAYRGNLALDNLRVLDRTTNQDFIRWESFSLDHIDASAGVGKPKLHVGEMALDNFDAGIILTSDGKLNLKDITSRPGARPSSAPGGEATMQVAPAAPTTPASQPAAQSTAAPVPLDVEIGAIDLSGGNVDYSDYFIKPNYSANLAEIVGSVGAFGTGATQPARVDLHGQINGNAPLSITGSINPLAPMAFVDLAVRAENVELIGFSPYTTKYTGYPIENGKLSADVHYLLNQGELKADNHIVIGQLKFGSKVENSTAVNLPIRVAVAILKDRNGVIDLNVPVSGSLSDPQFSIGGLVLNAFWKVIEKAATSPFSIIGAALGSGQDLSQVNFAPGYALLTPSAQQQLDTVASALEQRAKLKLNIQGCVDPAIDRDGLRNAMVDLAVREQKLKHTGGSGDPWEVKVEPDEYEGYLRRAYSAADFSKPRNFLGVAKSLPPAEMKKLMRASAKVTDADLGKLADARAAAVRKYLAAKVDASRLSVQPSELGAGGNKGQGEATQALLTLE